MITSTCIFCRRKSSSMLSMAIFCFLFLFAIPCTSIASFAPQSGKIEIDHNWTRVDFETPFHQPVVVASVASDNGKDPCVIRIKDVETTGFSIRLQEYNYLTGPHTKETVNYMVVDKGTYLLENGKQVEAGTFSAPGTKFVTQPFEHLFFEKPVLLTAVASSNGPDPVTGRVRNITKDGFDYTMQEEETLVDGHVPEMVHYIAWEPSKGVINGLAYEVVHSADAITDQFSLVNYGTEFKNTPLVLADMQTFNGTNTAKVRSINITDIGFDVRVEEEQSKDEETAHTTERVGFIAVADATNADVGAADEEHDREVSEEHVADVPAAGGDNNLLADETIGDGADDSDSPDYTSDRDMSFEKTDVLPTEKVEKNVPIKNSKLGQMIGGTIKTIGYGEAGVHGFFSLKVFKNELYAGGYVEDTGSGTQYPLLYHSETFAPNSLAIVPDSPLVTESICAMQEFDGQLYANTESWGKLFRSPNGTTWPDEIRGGPGGVGCALAVHNGSIFAANADFNSTTNKAIISKCDKPAGAPGNPNECTDKELEFEYLREIVSHNGLLYAFALDNVTKKGRLSVSKDGSYWFKIEVPFRGFRAASTNQGLLVGTSSDFTLGVPLHFDKSASIYKITPSGSDPEASDFNCTCERLYNHTDKINKECTSITSIEEYKFTLFATTMNGWATQNKYAQLLMSIDNGRNWEVIHTFNETETHDVEIYKEKLYVATNQAGGKGGVYAFDLSAIDKRAAAAAITATTSLLLGQ